MIRLQGIAFHTMKHNLTAVSYSKSYHGRIRVDYKDDMGRRYYHWLNPDESAEFDETSLPTTKWHKPRKIRFYDDSENKIVYLDRSKIRDIWRELGDANYVDIDEFIETHHISKKHKRYMLEVYK